MSDVVGLYIALGVVTLFFGLLVVCIATDHHDREWQRDGARVALLSPVWPLVVLTLLVVGVVWLWRLAWIDD